MVASVAYSDSRLGKAYAKYFANLGAYVVLNDLKEATSVAEERAFNPRLGDGLSENDFSLTMKNLRLAHPKQIDVAVPANMKCGFVEGHAPMADSDWAPLTVALGLPVSVIREADRPVDTGVR